MYVLILNMHICIQCLSANIYIETTNRYYLRVFIYDGYVGLCALSEENCGIFASLCWTEFPKSYLMI